MQVVWFKRDLRVQDHAPLAMAAAHGPVLALFIDEPGVLLAADQSTQHALFRAECLAGLQADLAQLGLGLQRASGDAVTVLERLHRLQAFTHLWSHEETGNALTYERDQRVALWCRTRGVAWQELPQHGVVRRLANRDGWARRWAQRMYDGLVPVPATIRAAPLLPALSADWQPCVPAGIDKPLRQRGGRPEALALLDSFLAGRGHDYRRAMSSPLSAEQACSRLSPYLALGVLSLRETVHALTHRVEHWKDQPAAMCPPGMLASLRSFQGRLHWHCHFMQKLESEPAIEFRNIHRGFDGLREDSFDRRLYLAWTRGETGLPMVDACLRMLAATGWVNFRMRAMLVSFASYQLWLHWREPALHLAREFLDFEPGIHYSQVQMQSGVTGINTLRIYNPVKQAHDQDPQGVFVRHWLPELAAVPQAFLFQPWLMPIGVQRDCCVLLDQRYPMPVVDHEQAARLARDRIHARRRDPAVREESNAVMEKHGSRKRTNDRAAAKSHARSNERSSARSSARSAKAAQGAGARKRAASGKPYTTQEGFDFGEG